MSQKQLALFGVVAVVTVLWSAQALFSHVVRLEHQSLIQMIREGDVAPKPSQLKAATASYHAAMQWAPCNTALHADYALPLAHLADDAMATDVAQGDAALAAMQQALLSRLACTPRDGKAWLDLAMFHVLREGAGPQALTAYRMSALAAPGESWLARKRLEFSLALLPILTEQELAVARADLAVLERAHPNNLSAVQAAAQVEDKQALYTLFGATLPSEAP